MSLKLEQEVLDQKLVSGNAIALDEILRKNNIHTDKLYKPEKQIPLQGGDKRKEVKTDFACPVSGAKISVKAHGAVNLCSIGMLQFCDYLDVSSLRAKIPHSEIEPFKEALLFQPLRLVGDEELDQWNDTNKVLLNQILDSVMDKYPNLKRELIRTALDGTGIFEGDAIATHVATPEKFEPITEEYIDKVVSLARLDVRTKGRGKLTVKGKKIRKREPSFRIDLNMKHL